MKRVSWFAGLAAAIWCAGCTGLPSPGDAGAKAALDSAEGETFGFRRWVSATQEPDVVIIGIHGFCGASIDYRNLGEYLLVHQPRTAVYAYELRGQGNDPILDRRGDIGNAADWHRDLFAFTGLVRERHPRARIVWFGESMGALIATHSWCEAADGHPPCDGLVLSSPIVRFRDDIPAWTPGLVQVAATALPLARVSLDSLTSGEEIPMTQHSTHGEQVKKNDYHVEKHTLRLLAALAKHIDGMNTCADELEGPVLVLHGGNDYFNNDSDVRGFIARISPDAQVTYRHYPRAYHLLMYDEKRDKIFRDVARWCNRLRRDAR
jgi:alpha-beta hydrolase superfamily lysophospholipase